jgi:hypothetical protein
LAGNRVGGLSVIGIIGWILPSRGIATPSARWCVDAINEPRASRLPSMAAMRAIETNDFAGASIGRIVPLRSWSAR